MRIFFHLSVIWASSQHAQRVVCVDITQRIFWTGLEGFRHLLFHENRGLHCWNCEYNWCLTLCSPVDRYQRFGATYCLPPQVRRVGFQFHKAEAVNTNVLRDVTLCSLVHRYQRVWGTCCLHLQVRRMRFEVHTSVTTNTRVIWNVTVCSLWITTRISEALTNSISRIGEWYLRFSWL